MIKGGIVVEYTGKDIMQKLQVIDDKLDAMKSKITKAQITSTTSITLVFLILIFVLNHISKVV